MRYNWQDTFIFSLSGKHSALLQRSAGWSCHSESVRLCCTHNLPAAWPTFYTLTHIHIYIWGVRITEIESVREWESERKLQLGAPQSQRWDKLSRTKFSCGRKVMTKKIGSRKRKPHGKRQGHKKEKKRNQHIVHKRKFIHKITKITSEKFKICTYICMQAVALLHRSF